MKKFISATILSISALALSNIATVEAATFTDVPSVHWAYNSIVNLADRGIINGYEDGGYYPSKTVTRAEFATIMTKCAGVQEGSSTTSIYADVVSGHWALPYINATSAYMTAYKSSSGSILFKPSDGALREDIAVALVKLKGYDINSANTSLLASKFTDTSSISTSALPYVAIAVEQGMISGYEDGTFRPNQSITRAEAAVLLERAILNTTDTYDKIIVDDILNAQSTPTTMPEYAPNTPTTMPEYAPNTPTTMPEYAPNTPTIMPEYSTNTPTTPEYSTNAPTTVVPTNSSNVTTISGFPTSKVDDYIVTGNNDVYYISNNKLMKQSSNGATETIMNGDSFSKEMYVKDLDKTLDPANASGEETTDSSTTSKLHYIDSAWVTDVAYDEVQDEVYYTTMYEVKSVDKGGYGLYYNYYITDIYKVKNGTNPIFTKGYRVNQMSVSREFKPSLTSDYMQVTNGDVLFTGFSGSGNGKTIYRFNASTNNYSIFSNNFKLYNSSKNKMMYVGSTLYDFSNGVKSYNLASNSWDSISLVKSINGTCYANYNGKIYFISNSKLYTYEEAGTNRWEAKEVLAFTDANIQDATPINDISSFSFDNDGNIIFVDSKSGALRKLEIDKSLLN